MPTKQNPAAPAASRQPLTDHAFLAEGRQFLTTLQGAAKAAGVPLDEFLLRAAFEDERTKKQPEVPRASVPFIRAAVRHNWDARWTSNAIVGHATCDMMHPTEDGGPHRHLPAAFDLAPDTQTREDARWLCYSEFCFAWSLTPWEDDVTGGHHTSQLREEAPGEFTTRLEGTTDDKRHAVEWAPLSVVCWFFGLEPEFLEKHINVGRLHAGQGEARELRFADVARLLEWLSKPSKGRGKAPAAVPMPEDARELYRVAEEAFRDQVRRGFAVIGGGPLAA